TNTAASNAAENKAARAGVFAPSVSNPSRMNVAARAATGLKLEIRRAARAMGCSVESLANDGDTVPAPKQRRREKRNPSCLEGRQLLHSPQAGEPQAFQAGASVTLSATSTGGRTCWIKSLGASCVTGPTAIAESPLSFFSVTMSIVVPIARAL